MARYLLLSFVVATAAAIAAAPAWAELPPPPGGDCENSPDGCVGPPPPPVKPSLPGLASKGGSYHVSVDGTTSNYRDGYVSGDQTTYFGGGPYHDIGGDGTLSVGNGSTVTLKASIADATAMTTATAAVNLSSQGDIGIGYLVELHAANAAAYAALKPFLGTSGAIAHIDGAYSLTQSGQAFATVSAQTGTGGYNFPLDPALQKVFYQSCDRSGYLDTTGAGCGAGGYHLDLNFAAGSSFVDGNRNSIYGLIALSTHAHAGATGTSGVEGTATAFIDPTISLSPLFNSPLYTLNTGTAIMPGSGTVPEPAAWALMVVGFAAVGSAARRGRPRVVAA